MTTSIVGSYEMARPNILRTKSQFTLPCCDDMEVDVHSRYIHQSSAMLKFASIDIDQHRVPVGHEVVIRIDVVESLTSSRRLGQNVSRLNCTPSIDLFPAEKVIRGSSTSVYRSDFDTIGLTPTPVDFTFSSLCGGQYMFYTSVVEVILSTNQSIRRNVISPNGLEVTVLGADNVVPSPRLLTAAFVDGGTDIELRFDSFTNMGDLGGVYFSCNVMLVFNEDPEAVTTCFWADSTRLILSLSPNSIVTVTDTIMLVGNKISSRYSPTAMVAEANVLITSKVTSAPTIRVTAGKVVSASSPFRLDLRTSSGSGGRQWSSVTINVSGIHSSVVSVNDYYWNLTSVEQLVNSLLPIGHFEFGQFYVFDITVCNCLGACGQAKHKVDVMEADTIPVVITGSAYKSVLRHNGISIQAVPEWRDYGFSSSSDFLSNFKPVYFLKVFRANNDVLKVTSAPPTTVADTVSVVFTLPAFFFPANSVYRLRITMRSSATPAYSTSRTECILKVFGEPLVAVLSTRGSTISLRQGTFLELHGRESYDGNSFPRQFMPAASDVLSFVWDCDVVTSNSTRALSTELASSPLLKEVGACHDMTVSSPTSSLHPLVRLGSSGYNAGDHLRLTLTVMSRIVGDMRSDAITVDVILVEPSAALIVIDEMGEGFNSDNVVKLPASVVASNFGVATWTIEDVPSANLASGASSLVSFVIAPFIPTMVFRTDLEISSSLLKPGILYTFKLSFVFTDLSLGEYSASVVVVKHRGPRPGVFSIVPSHGEALLTQFLFSTSQWESSDMPLRYSFGYVSSVSSAIILQEKAEYQSKLTILREGREKNYSLECFVTALDVVGRPMQLRVSVVSSPSTLNISEQVDLLNAELPPAAVQDILRVDCAQAPACGTLNRKNCSSSKHTCGSCLSDDFFGVIGSSNTRCVQIITDTDDDSDDIDDVGSVANSTDSNDLTLNATGANITTIDTNDEATDEAGDDIDDGVSPATTDDIADSGPDTAIVWSCFDDTMCGEFMICDEGTCIQIPKSCSTECVDQQGECGYSDDASGLRMYQCYIGDGGCSAVCFCAVGWYGPTCGISSAEVKESTAFASNSLCALAQQARIIRAHGVVDSEVINSWTTRLSFLTQNEWSFQLNVESAFCTLEILQLISENAAQANTTSGQLQVLWDTVEKLLFFQRYIDYPSLVLDTQLSRSLSGNLSTLLSSYCGAVHEIIAHHRRVPMASKQNRLYLRIETIETVPSRLDTCYSGSMLGGASFSPGAIAPLSSDFCVVTTHPLLYDVNVTAQLSSQLLSVSPPWRRNDTTSFTISVECPAPPPPPSSIYCMQNEIERKELQCVSDSAGEADDVIGTGTEGGYSTVGFSCTGLVTYNATCQDVNITKFNCSYLYCSVDDKNDSNPFLCQCSIPAVSQTAAVSFGTIVESVCRDFVKTFRDSGGISIDSRWKALLTLLSIMIFFIFTLVLTDKTDRYLALRVANNVQARERREEKGTVGVDEHCESRMTSLCAAMLRRANASFPDLFNKDSMSKILLAEMKRSHRWASLLFHHSGRRPRTLRLLVTISLINCVLFFNALFFKVTFYDKDRSCEKNWFERMCIEDPSRFAPNDSKCYWDELHYQCHYKKPSSNLSAMIWGVLASALLSVPVMMTLEFIVDEIFVRPTASPSVLPVSMTSAPVGPSPDSAEEVNEAAATYYSDDQDLREEETAITGSRHDLFKLASSLIEYRDTLELDELRHFDRRWGFATPFFDYFGPPNLDLDMYLRHQKKGKPRELETWYEGYDQKVKRRKTSWSIAAAFKKALSEGNQFAIFDQIMEEITLSRIHASREVRAMKGMSLRNKKKRLLQLFQLDLLVGMKSVVVAKLWSGGEPTHVQDRMMRPVRGWVKVTSYGLVASANVFFIGYVMIFCLAQDFAGQAMFLRLFGVWLAIEVIVISTLSILFTQVIFPLSIAYWDIVTLKKDLRKVILDHFGLLSIANASVQTGSNSTTEVSVTIRSSFTDNSLKSLRQCDVQVPVVNVCPYLFVSHRVAAHFPELLESTMVLGFHSSYPKISFSGTVGVTFRQRALYVFFAILHCVTVCTTYIAGIILNPVLGYQAASVLSWCLFGLITTLDTSILQFDTSRGVVFIIVLGVTIVYIVKDMLKRLNQILKEQNELLFLATEKNLRKSKTDAEVSTETLEMGTITRNARMEPLAPSALPFTRRIGDRVLSVCRENDKEMIFKREHLQPEQDFLSSMQVEAPLIMSVDDMTSAALELDLKQAHLKLTQALITEEDEDPDVFRPWSQLSVSLMAMFNGDQYYVDNTGQPLSRMALSTKFVQLQLNNPGGFQREVNLTKQRRWRLRQWDQYRLCDSENILAFVDRHGRRFSEAAIREHRATIAPVPSDDRPRELSETVLRHFEEKHAAENKLLTFNENVASLMKY
jgi:hypothetical protein